MQLADTCSMWGLFHCAPLGREKNAFAYKSFNDFSVVAKGVMEGLQCVCSVEQERESERKKKSQAIWDRTKREDISLFLLCKLP